MAVKSLRCEAWHDFPARWWHQRLTPDQEETLSAIRQRGHSDESHRRAGSLNREEVRIGEEWRKKKGTHRIEAKWDKEKGKNETEVYKVETWMKGKRKGRKGQEQRVEVVNRKDIQSPETHCIQGCLLSPQIGDSLHWEGSEEHNQALQTWKRPLEFFVGSNHTSATAQFGHPSTYNLLYACSIPQRSTPWSRIMDPRQQNYSFRNLTSVCTHPFL